MFFFIIVLYKHFSFGFQANCESKIDIGIVFWKYKIKLTANAHANNIIIQHAFYTYIVILYIIL